MTYLLELSFDNVDELCLIKFENNYNSKFFLEKLKLLPKIPDKVFVQGHEDKKFFLEKFTDLVYKANLIFNLSWDIDNLSRENFNLWHKDIELLSLKNLKLFSEEQKNLLIDVHHTLHQLENAYYSKQKLTYNIQIKWHQLPQPWPEIPKFIPFEAVKSGDIIADFGHVGKTPFQCMKENDNSNLKLTCKLPINYCPGFFIKLVDSAEVDIVTKDTCRKNHLTNWYYQNIETLSEMFSLETMLQYTGVHKLGTIENKSIVPKLQQLTSTNVEIVSINC